MVEELTPRAATTRPGEPDGLPFDAETSFTNVKGVHKPRIEKKQRALAKKIPELSKFLEDGEKVRLITTAVSPTSIVEQLTTGVLFAFLKRCLLVLTDRRLIHIPTTMNYKYRNSIAHIRFGDLSFIAQKFSQLKIKYNSGDKERFLFVRRAERRKLRMLLQEVSHEGPSSNTAERTHLCPRCTAELTPEVFECPECSLEFKNRKKARMLSLLVPGGGYFYTGHPLLGIIDAVVEILLILVLILVAIPTPEFPGIDYVSILFVLGALAIEKVITIHHANRNIDEYLPASKDLAQSGSGAIA